MLYNGEDVMTGEWRDNAEKLKHDASVNMLLILRAVVS